MPCTKKFHFCYFLICFNINKSPQAMVFWRQNKWNETYYILNMYNYQNRYLVVKLREIFDRFFKCKINYIIRLNIRRKTSDFPILVCFVFAFIHYIMAHLFFFRENNCNWNKCFREEISIPVKIELKISNIKRSIFLMILKRFIIVYKKGVICTIKKLDINRFPFELKLFWYDL